MGAALPPLPCILPLNPPPSGHGVSPLPDLPPTYCCRTVMIDTPVSAETPSRKREREISQEPMTPSVVCLFIYSVLHPPLPVHPFPPSLPPFAHLSSALSTSFSKSAWLTRGSIVFPLPSFPLPAYPFFSTARSLLLSWTAKHLYLPDYPLHDLPDRPRRKAAFLGQAP
jgi:hypothetical protein